MGTLTNIIVFGASRSALYMLVAIGFTMIFSIGGIANLAHGAFLMAGAYIVFLLVGAGVLVFPSLIVSIALVAVGALVLYYLFFRPIEEQHLTALIVTLLVGLIVEELVGIFITHESRSIPPIIEGVFRIGGAPVPYNRALAFGISWLCVAGVWYFVTRTQVGRAVLATSIDKKGATSLGINATYMEFIVWGIAGGLAAIAGYFWGSFSTITPAMGFNPMLIGFVIVVIGGLGSITGAAIAAYIVGVLETSAALLIDPGAQGLFSFGILILVLLYRPEGLFGKRDLSLD